MMTPRVQVRSHSDVLGPRTSKMWGRETYFARKDQQGGVAKHVSCPPIAPLLQKTAAGSCTL